VFEQYFSAKRLLITYILGGIFGNIFEIIFSFIYYKSENLYVLGASGAVMAILVATAFYKPKLSFSVFGLFNIRLIYIAMIFILLNIYNAGMKLQDGTAYFAHIGGAFLGYISVRNPFSHSNIINITARFVDYIKNFKLKKSNSSKKYSSNSKSYFKTDEEYNFEAKQRQKKIDDILDKISKYGYDSLSKLEKEFLFKQSKK
jgi:hypothetical protein